jgi:RNA polymerase sigma-70 factor, ECF subfamily
MVAPSSSFRGSPAGADAPSPEQVERRLSASVERHHQLVWRAFRRLGVAEREVDDAAQQVFLTFAQRIADVAAGKEAAFLAAVSVKIAANARRKVARSPEVLGSDVDVAEEPTTPERLLNDKQRRAELDRGLALLPEEQRAVFVLFELEGFSLPEIAEALGVPLGTATSRLRRARLRFETWAREREPTEESP